MSEPVVLHQKRGSVFWITLNRPERRNAINNEVIALIGQGFADANADPAVRVIVLTGAGDRAFCAGGDLQPGQAFGFDTARPDTDYANLLRQVRQSPLPSIARINGLCLAGGFGLLSMVDMAVASETAMFGLPEIKIGIFPMQVLSLLQHLAPPRLVREWCLTGELFDAHAARQAGLVNSVVPAADLDARIDALAGQLARHAPGAIRRGKYALRAMEGMSFEQGLAYGEAQIALVSGTADAREGMAAFIEKRQPNWAQPPGG